MSAIKQLNDFLAEFELTLKSAATKKAMAELGNFMIAMIVKRTRQGFGVQKVGTSKVRLDALSDSYETFRKRNRDKLDSTTRPGKSNLTFSGVMLKSLRVKENTGTSIVIGANRRPRKGGLTNEDLAEFAEAGSSNRPRREFMSLTDRELERTTRFIDRKLSRTIAKNL